MTALIILLAIILQSLINGLIIIGKMENKPNRILSLDGGGIKGLYSILIIDSIQDKYQVNFNLGFDCYAGTSIGAVIASALAYGISPKEILLKFSTFKNDLNKGHIYLEHPPGLSLKMRL